MKKIFGIVISIIGILAGIASIAAGVSFAVSPSGSRSTKDPRHAVFGADFYTYQYEATEYAAYNAGATAKTVGDMSEKLALYAGAAFILAGVLTVLHYGNRCAELCLSDKAEAVLPETAEEGANEAEAAPATLEADWAGEEGADAEACEPEAEAETAGEPVPELPPEEKPEE